MLVASSGLHANGASLARLIAGRLPDGYATELPDGETFGEALLAPSVMYVPLIAALLEDEDVELKYLSHITGHGLLKLMRPNGTQLPRSSGCPRYRAVLELPRREAGMDAQAAYSTFNMGAGFAFYCRAGDGERVVATAARLGLDALLAGRVEKGPRQVVLEPVDVRFAGDRLELSVGQT